MAMTRGLWSINGLATELNKDRRNDWQHIDYGGRTGDFSIADAATLMKETPETILQWVIHAARNANEERF